MVLKFGLINHEGQFEKKETNLPRAIVTFGLYNNELDSVSGICGGLLNEVRGNGTGVICGLENCLGNVKGAAIAIRNDIKENTHGITLGLMNKIKNANGVTIGFFGNSIRGETNGITVGVFVNVLKGEAKGIMFGIWNELEGNVNGVDLAGWNFVRGDVTGLTWSIGNEIKGNVKGITSGLWTTVGRDANGLLFGLGNDIGGDTKGVALSWICNHTKKMMNGVSVSLVNVSERLRGVTVGLVNIVKKGSSGLQIGLLNIRSDAPWYARYIPIIAIRHSDKTAQRPTEQQRDT